MNTYPKKTASKLLAALLASVLFAAVLAGCGGSSTSPEPAAERYDLFVSAAPESGDGGSAWSEADYDSWDLEAAVVEEWDVPVDDAVNITTGGSGEVDAVIVNESAVAGQRKLIRTVHLNMESTEYDASAVGIQRIVNELGGYIEYSDIAGNVDMSVGVDGVSTMGQGVGAAFTSASEPSYRSGDRYMFLRIRIPEEKLDLFLDRVEGYGNVLTKQESSDDITLQYVDVESRINALKAEQESLLALLEQAVSVEDMILLQDRLSYIRYQLETYESQLRVMSNQVSYSTVNLTLNEVVVYTPKEEFNPTMGQRISTGFGRTLRDIKSFWVNLAVWAAVNSIYLVGWAVAIVVFVVFVRRMRRKLPKIERKPSLTKPEQTGEEGPEGSKKKQVTQTARGGNPWHIRLLEWWESLFVPPFQKLDRWLTGLLIAFVGVALGARLPFFWMEEYARWLPTPLIVGVAVLCVAVAVVYYLSFVALPLAIVALLRRLKVLRHQQPEDRGAFSERGTKALLAAFAVCALVIWLMGAGLITSFF